MPPNEKISDLDAAAPLVLSDHVLVARGSAPPNLKATIQAVLALSGGVGGGGTINKIPLWTSPGVLGDSALSQSGVNITAAGNFVVSRIEEGSGVFLTVTNNEGGDSASHAIVNITTIAGNPHLRWGAGLQVYVLGIDHSDGDKLVGSVGAVLGTGNWLEVTTARGITLDAASGQTVALAVNSVEELQVSGTAVTIPTNDLIVDGGNIGITAQTNLIAMASNRLTVNGDLSLNSSGGTTDLTVEGMEVIRASSGAIIIGAVTTGATAVTVRASGGDAIRIDVDKNVEIPNGDFTVATGDAEITGGMLGIGNPPTLPLDVHAKAGITSIGGVAIKLTNKTGLPTVKGQLVSASTGTDDAFTGAIANSVEVIGVVLEAGVADGSEAWVVISGKAEVLMDGDGCTRGDRIGSGGTAGSGAALTSPSNTEHFREIGHSFQTVGGLTRARVDLHFN